MSQVEELNLLRTWGFEGYAHDSEWPQVADAVIEAHPPDSDSAPRAV